MSTLQNGASVSHSAVIISGSKSRARLAVVHDEPDVDTVGKPLSVLAPRVVLVPQPPPETPTAMKTARFIGVSCKETIERERDVA